MSKWQAEKAERNRQSLARLNKALPRIFPSAVLSWALGRPFVPPTPRLAVDSYWRAHPIRADRLARALAARSGSPSGWTWQLGNNRKHGLPATYRTPPTPYRERAYMQGPGFCCVCGQPVYRFGWHVDLSTRPRTGNTSYPTGVSISSPREWRAKHEHPEITPPISARTPSIRVPSRDSGPVFRNAGCGFRTLRGLTPLF